MNKAMLFVSMLVTEMIAGGAIAQDADISTEQWLERSRPLIGVQLCDNPRAPFRVAFDGTTQECKAEADRLYVKCMTEVPNVRLPGMLMSMDDQMEAGVLLYECVSSYYVGGATLEEFKRRYPLEPPPEDGSAD